MIFEEESKQDVHSSKALLICEAMQEDRWTQRPELTLPWPLLICFGWRTVHSCAIGHQSWIGVAKGLKQIEA
jgi:hypothetical protein